MLGGAVGTEDGGQERSPEDANALWRKVRYTKYKVY